MLLDMKGDTENNDTWQPLSLATRRLLKRCEEQQRENGASNAGTTKQAHEREKDRLRYLEYRISELMQFEEK